MWPAASAFLLRAAGGAAAAALSALVLAVGCERADQAVTDAVVAPIQALSRADDRAALEAAVASARAVRTALLARRALDPEQRYPSAQEIRDYDTLRQALPEAGLPSDMAAARWDAAVGVDYSSDGTSFTLVVRTATAEPRTLTVTPGSVEVR